MRIPLAVAALVAFALTACGAEPAPSCGAIGRSAPCACPGGAQGAQECGPLGVWGACACPGADAGAETAAPDAPPPPVDGPGVPEAGVDAPEVAADAPAPLDGPTDAAGDASVCPQGWGECSPGACVNLASTAAHCGRCGAACSPMWRCERGSCVSPTGVTCDPGRADCDRNEGNGCEASLRGDHTNCGACGNNCRERGLFCREGVCAP